MKREVSDERLQDYLDGRLSDDERARIEARIGRDPALARRVEAGREIRRALRAESGELSPDFYARARERFEQTTRSHPPWGFRVLSWEAAGLAAAVVLAAVLFLPEMTRHRDLTGSALRPAADAADASPADKTSPAQPSRRRDERRSDDVAGDAAPSEAPWKARQPIDPPSPSVGDEGRVAPSEDRREKTVAEPAAPVSPPAQKPAPEVGGKGSAVAGDRAATVPPPGSPGPGGPAPSSEAQEAYAEEAPRRSEGDKKRRVLAAAPAESEAHARAVDRDASSTRGVVVAAVGLPADVAPADGIRGITDRAIWEALEGGPGAEALGRLGGYDADRRLVLIGRTSGLDCDALEVLLDARGYRMRLPRAGPAAGCALLLPRDGLPIVLDAATGE